MSVTALVSGPGQDASGGAALRSKIAVAIPGVPFSFQRASWSIRSAWSPGHCRRSPANAGERRYDTPAGGLHGRDLSPRDPAGRPLADRPDRCRPCERQRIESDPAALPASAAALLHVSVGDQLRLRDRLNNAQITVDITGRSRSGGARPGRTGPQRHPRQRGVRQLASTTYGPLVVSQGAFGPC